MMLWLALALALMGVSWWAAKDNRLQLAGYARIGFLLSLFLWFFLVTGLPARRGGEEGLLRWFAWGLGAALLGELAALWPRFPYRLAPAAIPLSAMLYALGFDPFRPNEYAYLTAAILGGLVLLVAARVYVKFGKSTVGRGRLALAAWTLAMAGLVYASSYKMMDRGWLLPWAYAASAGGLLFALSQLGWARSWLPGAEGAGRGLRVTYDLAHLLIVVAAFSHYRQFL